MIDEIKYEKYGNLDLFKKKNSFGIYSTRNYTAYTTDLIKKLIFKFKDSHVFYFTFDFYLRSGIYKIKNVDFRKIIITESKYLDNNLIKNSDAQVCIGDYEVNRRLQYLIKDLVILNFVKKIIILEATKFSHNLKILSEIAAEKSVDVFCIPGRVNDSSSYGTNKLIYEGGIPLFDFDILSS